MCFDLLIRNVKSAPLSTQIGKHGDTYTGNCSILRAGLLNRSQALCMNLLEYMRTIVCHQWNSLNDRTAL